MPFLENGKLGKDKQKEDADMTYIVELSASWFTSPKAVLISPMWWGYLAKKHTWKGFVTSLGI
jgi:hypothetical protein